MTRRPESDARNRGGGVAYGLFPDGPPDVRRDCDTRNVRHYSFEVMQIATANSTPTSRAQTAASFRGGTDGKHMGIAGDNILAPVQAKEGCVLTGKKSKLDCLRHANTERLVGQDVQAWVGMRVTVSSRAKNIRKLGDLLPGTVVEIREGGECCMVAWDDGTGPPPPPCPPPCLYMLA